MNKYEQFKNTKLDPTKQATTGGQTAGGFGKTGGQQTVNPHINPQRPLPQQGTGTQRGATINPQHGGKADLGKKDAWKSNRDK